MTNIIQLKPNARTHDRLRRQREQVKQQLIKRIGIRYEDAPLYDEELRFMAYEESQHQGLGQGG